MSLLLFIGLVISTVVLAGVFGGWIGQILLVEKNGSDSQSSPPIPRLSRESLVLGIAAATLIPLFLKMADSQLLAQIAGDNYQASFINLVVLFGFCSLAAMSSRRFLTSMSERFLQDMKQETRNMKRVAAEVQETIGQTQRQAAVDAQALELIEDWLDPDASPVASKEDIQSAVSGASPSMNSFFFRKVSGFRRATWKKRPELMERVKAVVRGLLSAEGGSAFHQNHALMAFALKDSETPNLEAAEKAFSEAIRVRDTAGRKGYRYYEFNRGLCRAALDNEANPESRTEGERAREIKSDLQAGRNYAWFGDRLKDQPVITEWLSRNGISVASLMME